MLAPRLTKTALPALVASLFATPGAAGPNADLNGDGTVGPADVARMNAVFFSADAAADLNGDGVVNFADLVLLKSQLSGESSETQGASGVQPSISLIPAVFAVDEPDTFTLTVRMDFTPDPTLGGGVDIQWDANTLTLVSWDPIPTGNPVYSRPGDVTPGLIDGFAFGDFDGLTGPADVATITFQAVTPGFTDVNTTDDVDGIAGPFVSAVTFGIQNVDFFGSTVEVRIGDSDDDGVPNNQDNCPLESNFNQADFDGDGAGDVCDIDVAAALVTGFESDNIVRFDLLTGESTVFASLSSGDKARGITVGREGTVFVARRNNGQNIVRFDSSGGALGDFTLPVPPAGPGFLDLSDTGDLLAGGTQTVALLIYDADSGDLLRPVFSPGAQDPFYTGILSAQNVAFAANARSGDVFRIEISQPGDLTALLIDGSNAPVGPQGMTIGHTGNLFVTGQISMVEYDPVTGAFVNQFVDNFQDLGIELQPSGRQSGFQSGDMTYSPGLSAYLLVTRTDSLYALNTAGDLVATFSSPFLQSAASIAVPGSPPDLAAKVEVDVSSIEFSPAVPGSSTQAAFSVSNTGNSVLLIGELGAVDPLLSPFSIASDSCSNQQLGSGAACDVTVEFSPVSGGTFMDSVSISTNDPASPRVVLELTGRADSDADGIVDENDNCTLVANPDQRDTDADGIGNICDADLTNDCVTSFSDLAILKAQFFTVGDVDADLDGDGLVNFIDLGIIKQRFFTTPGPSGVANFCAPICGDAALNFGESCDDGNTMPGDGCSSSCAIEAGWDCDIPMSPGPSSCMGLCGDGLIVDQETCDDGNEMDGDGCSSACGIEAGWECALPPEGGASECNLICSNGLVDAGEQCDDANVLDGDGCTSSCEVEDDWVCTLPAPPGPSVCTECILETFDSDGVGSLGEWSVFNAGAVDLDWGTTDAEICEGVLPLDNYTGGAGEAACIRDFGFVNDTVDAYLCSPPLDLTGSVATELAFLVNYQRFNLDSNDRFEVLVGTQPPSGVTVGSYSVVYDTTDSLGTFLDTPGIEVSLDVPALDGQPGAYVCFRYSALLDRYAQVDDVAIGPAACAAAVRFLRK